MTICNKEEVVKAIKQAEAEGIFNFFTSLLKRKESSLNFATLNDENFKKLWSKGKNSLDKKLFIDLGLDDILDYSDIQDWEEQAENVEIEQQLEREEEENVFNSTFLG